MSFKRLMALETLDQDTYRAIAPAWAPGDGMLRPFSIRSEHCV
jgi:hypothetical protein